MLLATLIVDRLNGPWNLLNMILLYLINLGVLIIVQMHSPVILTITWVNTIIVT